MYEICVMVTCFELKEMSKRALLSYYPRLPFLLRLSELESHFCTGVAVCDQGSVSMEGPSNANLTAWGLGSIVHLNFVSRVWVRITNLITRSQTWENDPKSSNPESGPNHQHRKQNGFQEPRCFQGCMSISFAFVSDCWFRTMFSPKCLPLLIN